MSVRTLLVASDDADLRTFVGITLEGEGFYVYEARNAVTVLKLAREALPEVILLDAKMPGIAGGDVVQVLRDEDETANVPMILIDGVLDSAEIARANAVIRRPFGPDELKVTVAQALQAVILPDSKPSENTELSGGAVPLTTPKGV